VEAADEIFSCCEVDAGFAADGGVDLREQCGGDLHVADAAHVDGGEEAGDIADDAATEGEEESVAVGSGGAELLREGFDAAHALVALARGVKEDGWRFFEGGEEGLRPEGPDVGRGDDEGAEGLLGVELLQTCREGAEEVWGDGDVVGCRWRVDWNDGHDVFIVSHVIALPDEPTARGAARSWRVDLVLLLLGRTSSRQLQ
jgi:hypothetical protein